jgi:hypothetical protein
VPRRPPSRVRAHRRRPRRPTPIDGVPLATCRALDRLDRPSLTSRSVRDGLVEWHRVAQQPVAELRREYNDWIRFIGPFARHTLEQAMNALPRHHRAPLRREVARIDAVFLDRTLNDPRADPSRPWWERRC